MYNVKNYIEQDGDKSVIGGELSISSTGKITAAGTQAVAITDAKANYVTPELDTEAEVIVALNLTNTKLNAVLAALRGVGIIVT